MWTRAELKARAKECLKKYYWAAFFVSLIFGLVSGGFNSSSSNSTNRGTGSYGTDSGFVQEFAGDKGIDVPDGALGDISGIVESVPIGGSTVKLGRMALGIATGMLLMLLVVALVFGVFITPAVEVGQNRFYMESRLIGKSAGIGKVGWGFSNHYLNIVVTMFLRAFFITLGTICFVIPGIYLSYCYYMVPFILSENPEMKPFEAMSLSKKMMEGHKMNTFVLELSFFGWFLLGALCCGVGVLFVTPYFTATMAELYAVLRGPYSGSLNGFGYPDVVPTGSYGGTYVDQNGGYGYGQNDSQNNGYGYNQNNGYGYNQDNGYGYNQNGGYGYNQNDGYGYNQNSGYGYNQNNGYGYNQHNTQNGGGTDSPQEGGQYGGWNEFHEPNAESNPGGGPDGGAGQTNQGGQSYGGGYYQGTGDNRIRSGNMDQTDGKETVSGDERDTEVSRSQGGPGRGYYLNGVFYPYTDDDK